MADAPEVQKAPTHCPTCEVEFEEDLVLGNYVVVKCPKCGLNIRTFGLEKMVAFFEGKDEKTVDLAGLLAKQIDRHPPEVHIPAFDLSDIDSDFG